MVCSSLIFPAEIMDVLLAMDYYYIRSYGKGEAGVGL